MGSSKILTNYNNYVNDLQVKCWTAAQKVGDILAVDKTDQQSDRHLDDSSSEIRDTSESDLSIFDGISDTYLCYK